MSTDAVPVQNSAIDTPPSRMPRLRLQRLSLMFLAITLVALGVAFSTYRLSREQGFQNLQNTGFHRLALYSASLEREISQYAYFPATLGLERDVLDLLDARLTGKVNHYLEELNARAGTLAIYIMNRSGYVLAASNWQQTDSFIGENLSFRPYFRDALARGKGRFFGIGTTRGQPGYYLSSPLLDGDNVIGVAAVKVSLEQLERSWSTVEAPVFVADENGVIILSSVPSWKFTTLKALDEATRLAFDHTQQYNRRALQPLGLQELGHLGEHTRLVRIARSSEDAASVYPVSGKFLAQSQTLANSNWTLTVLSNAEPINAMSTVRAAVAGTSTVLLCILVILFNERRRRVQDRLDAREALQAAYDALERKVTDRTRDLSLANSKLQEEVAERARTERTLRETQNSLIQAGKLAVIGQLSAGIAHEINQPLAALRTLSANTVRFLERGDQTTARSNLERIAQLADRMGQITSELKHFARKSSGQARPTDLHQILRNAAALLANRLRDAQAEVVCVFPQQTALAWCDANRIEQVLVNLLGNALDAMNGLPTPRIEVTASRQEKTVRLSIRDYGTGLTDDVLPHLFEPFFTTKDASQGLGLGLAISAKIAADSGGALSAGNHPERGAVFTLELPLAEGQPQ